LSHATFQLEFSRSSLIQFQSSFSVALGKLMGHPLHDFGGKFLICCLVLVDQMSQFVACNHRPAALTPEPNIIFSSAHCPRYSSIILLVCSS
jgi:hypothetical protein